MEELDWTVIGARHLGQRPLEVRTRKKPRYGPPIAVAHLQLPLRRWDGEFVERGPENAGKGRAQVYSLDGGEPRRSCQEVEVAKQLCTIREHALWYTDWGQLPKTPWMPWVLKSREAPRWLLSLDAEIRLQISSPRGGTPDVVAWNEDEPLASALFVECKGLKEGFNENQEDWVWAARNAGVQSPQFAVAVLPFMP